MPEKLLDAGDARFYVRDGTLDWENVDEYKHGHWQTCDFRPGDRWLDAGGHIGTFCIPIASKVEFVASYEPAPSNYELLCQNLVLNSVQNVTPYWFALVGNDDLYRSFYLEPRKNKGTHSLIKRESRFVERRVPCFNINRALVQHRINCIEMDVEGAEVELVYAIDDWGPIRQLYLEYHNHVLRDGDLSGLAGMLDFLRARFDEVRIVDEIRHPLWRIVVARRGTG